MCLSLDDEGEHGQYVWKFEGGVASERAWPRGLLETAGRLKERHVGFCAMLSGGAAAAASAEAVAQAPAQARLVEGAQAPKAARQWLACGAATAGGGREI